MSRAMRHLGEAYTRSEDLALAAYRLERALRTGYTFAAPGRTASEERLHRLRSEFVDAVDAVAPSLIDEMGFPDFTDTGELVGVDAMDDLADVLDKIAADTEAFAKDALRKIGPDGYATLAEADPKADPDELFERAATASAAEAARIARRAGRTAREVVFNRDDRVAAYARVCAKPQEAGHPCHFCTMLMSRGAVYRTERGAVGPSPDGYHTNCDCEPVLIWNDREYETDLRFAKNREYQQLWKDNIAGKYSGKDALNAWRRLLNAMRKDQPNAAQEAA